VITGIHLYWKSVNHIQIIVPGEGLLLDRWTFYQSHNQSLK